jgi:hypothetical protein
MVRIKNRKKLTVLVLTALLILAIPSGVYAAEMEQSEDAHVEFAANIEFMRGHFIWAIADKQQNELVLATAHAAHPISELYALIEGELEEHDKELNSSLNSALEQLPRQVESLPATQFAAEVTKIEAMLDDALKAVVPQSKIDDHEFWIKVTIKLLETAVEEYHEGVSDGKVQEMVEYQDAQGFVARADAIFKSIASKIDEHEQEEIEEFFADLKNGMENVQEPAQIETLIDGIVREFKDVAGIEEEVTTEETTAQQYIENAKELLEQVSVEYKEGNFAEADKLAVLAYLENFEFVESDLENLGAEDLMGEIEQMMRVELRDMIKNKVSQDELDSHISAINEKLEQAYAIVPEFPAGLTIVLASVIGAMVALTRMKRFGLGRY